MKANNPKIKVNSKMHPRNKHQGRYDFEELVLASSSLESFVRPNKYGDVSIDFSDSSAVKELNRALLLVYYGIKDWDIPEGYLCPPIPGRADYIHYVADLIYGPKGNNTQGKITCLDIGVGANCIYPIIGVTVYGWRFIGSDISKKSIASASKIVKSNSGLKGAVDLREQTDKSNIFKDIISEGDRIDLTICNPPFHASALEAQKGSLRKAKNLNYKEDKLTKRNFAGQQNELWYEGGEINFLLKMISESKQYKKSVLWFTTLVSKESNLKSVYQALKSTKAVRVETIAMGQGNKVSRIVAWTFLSVFEQQKWDKERR